MVTKVILPTKEEKKKNEKETKKLNKRRENEIVSTLQQMDIEDIKCGIGSCTPSWLQVFARTTVYLMVYCVSGLVLGMFFTYTVSVLSTLEKRFKLTSKQTGVMLAGNDISQVMFSIVLAYFGNHGNRPKWLGIGILSASVACFVTAIPHFVYGPGPDAVSMATSLSASGSLGFSNSSAALKNDLCHKPYSGDCQTDGSSPDQFSIGALIILFCGEFFVGLTLSTFYSLGFVYLDDNINKKEFPVYYALSLIIRIVGPVAGFFLGSKCLALYIDPSIQPNMSTKDPRWMGAWWIGYLFLGGVLLVCGVIILLFPKILPTTLFRRIRRTHQKKFGDSLPPSNTSDLTNLMELANAQQKHIKPSLKELPFALKKLFQNKIWLAHTFNTLFAIMGLTGYWNFKPKYLEFQFRKSASTANFYTGVASLVASIAGLTISGILVKVFRPGPRVIAAYNCILTVFSALSMFSLIFVGCPQVNIVGSQFSPSNVSGGSCTQGCECTDRYSPVCSSDGLTTFYSPCYAGCTTANTSASPVEYLNCECLSPLALNGVPVYNGTQTPNLYEITGGHSSLLAEEAKTVQGYCPETCNTFIYYIIILIITKTIDSTGKVGSTLIFLRCVEEHEKGLALGVAIVMYSLFAFIPAPIIVGAIVDSACIIWDNSCGHKGNCWLYDSDKFRLIIHLVPGIFILVSLIGDIVVFLYSKSLVLYGEDEQVHNEDQDKELQNTPNGCLNHTNKENGQVLDTFSSNLRET